MLFGGLAFLLLLNSAATGRSLDDPTDLDLDGLPGLRSLPLNRPVEGPSALSGSGKLLILRTHGSNFNVDGFTNYLASHGWTVALHSSGPISAPALSGYNVLMVPGAVGASLTPFLPIEIAAIDSFVLAGGGLWIVHDTADPTGINSLTSGFGVSFMEDFVYDPTDNEGIVNWPTVHLLASHPTTDGVSSYGYYGGLCLFVDPPATVTAKGDEDAYSDFCPPGTFPPTLAIRENGGRMVFSGDLTPLHPAWYPALLRPEEQLLLQNIANWLLGPKPTATETSSWGQVKGLYR